MDLYKIWWQWPEYIEAHALSLTLNSVQVHTCHYNMFRVIIFTGHGVGFQCKRFYMHSMRENSYVVMLKTVIS